MCVCVLSLFIVVENDKNLPSPSRLVQHTQEKALGSPWFIWLIPIRKFFKLIIPVGFSFQVSERNNCSKIIFNIFIFFVKLYFYNPYKVKLTFHIEIYFMNFRSLWLCISICDWHHDQRMELVITTNFPHYPPLPLNSQFSEKKTKSSGGFKRISEDPIVTPIIFLKAIKIHAIFIKET